MTTSVTGANAGVSPARAAALRVLRRVTDQRAYADRALEAEARGLSPRDRALATQLAFGTVQRQLTLDHVIEQLAGRSPAKLEPALLDVLRLGVMQIAFLDGIADHAAVNEGVEQAKTVSRKGAGLANAVLRRATREAGEIVSGLGDGSPRESAIKYSVPVWIAELWWEELGAQEARALMAAQNTPAEAALRLNTLAGDPAELAERLPVRWRAVEGMTEAVVLEEPFDVHGSDMFAAGMVMPQSRASMRVARTLAPQPGERVLDLCAAPGGKTTHLAALMADQGELVAVERNRSRAAALRRTLERMRVSIAEVIEADAGDFEGDGFDRVLVDPPCSGLGTLRSRPDRRWRADPSATAELVAIQRRILQAGKRALKPGGTLVYSVCTISRAESEGVVGQTADSWRTFPHRDGTDGFYVSRVRAP